MRELESEYIVYRSFGVGHQTEQCSVVRERTKASYDALQWAPLRRTSIKGRSDIISPVLSLDPEKSVISMSRLSVGATKGMRCHHE